MNLTDLWVVVDLTHGSYCLSLYLKMQMAVSFLFSFDLHPLQRLSFVLSPLYFERAGYALRLIHNAIALLLVRIHGGRP